MLICFYNYRKSGLKGLNLNCYNCSRYDHVLGWWACRHSNPNFHYVKYEDMKNNPVDTLRNLVDFLGVSVTEDQAKVNATTPVSPLLHLH